MRNTRRQRPFFFQILSDRKANALWASSLGVVSMLLILSSCATRPPRNTTRPSTRGASRTQPSPHIKQSTETRPTRKPTAVLKPVTNDSKGKHRGHLSDDTLLRMLEGNAPISLANGLKASFVNGSNTRTKRRIIILIDFANNAPITATTQELTNAMHLVACKWSNKKIDTIFDQEILRLGSLLILDTVSSNATSDSKFLIESIFRKEPSHCVQTHSATTLNTINSSYVKQHISLLPKWADDMLFPTHRQTPSSRNHTHDIMPKAKDIAIIIGPGPLGKMDSEPNHSPVQDTTEMYTALSSISLDRSKSPSAEQLSSQSVLDLPPKPSDGQSRHDHSPTQSLLSSEVCSPVLQDSLGKIALQPVSTDVILNLAVAKILRNQTAAAQKNTTALELSDPKVCLRDQRSDLIFDILAKTHMPGSKQMRRAIQPIIVTLYRPNRSSENAYSSPSNNSLTSFTQDIAQDILYTYFDVSHSLHEIIENRSATIAKTTKQISRELHLALNSERGNFIRRLLNGSKQTTYVQILDYLNRLDKTHLNHTLSKTINKQEQKASVPDTIKMESGEVNDSTKIANAVQQLSRRRQKNTPPHITTRAVSTNMSTMSLHWPSPTKALQNSNAIGHFISTYINVYGSCASMKNSTVMFSATYSIFDGLRIYAKSKSNIPKIKEKLISELQYCLPFPHLSQNRVNHISKVIALNSDTSSNSAANNRLMVTGVTKGQSADTAYTMQVAKELDNLTQELGQKPVINRHIGDSNALLSVRSIQSSFEHYFRSDNFTIEYLSQRIDRTKKDSGKLLSSAMTKKLMHQYQVFNKKHSPRLTTVSSGHSISGYRVIPKLRSHIDGDNSQGFMLGFDIQLSKSLSNDLMISTLENLKTATFEKKHMLRSQSAYWSFAIDSSRIRLIIRFSGKPTATSISEQTKRLRSLCKTILPAVDTIQTVVLAPPKILSNGLTSQKLREEIAKK